MNPTVMTTVTAILLGGLAARACYRLKQVSDRLARTKDVNRYIYGQYIQTSDEKARVEYELRKAQEELDVYKTWATPEAGQPIPLRQSLHYSSNDVKYTKDEIRELVTANVIKDVLPYVHWTSHTVGNTVFCEASLLVVDKGVARRGVHDIQGDNLYGKS